MKSTGTPFPSSSTWEQSSNLESPVLSVKNLSAYYGSLSAVDSVSFDLFPGKTLAIVGESGSGKSTLALSIMGAHPGDVTGDVFFKGEKIMDMTPLRGAKISMIFQDPSSALNPVYTIGWQIMEAIDCHYDMDEEEAYKLAIKSLQEVQFTDPEIVFNKYPHELSGGQRQRAMIAMAIVLEPDVLIADEPTTALDVSIQMEIIDLLRRQQRNSKKRLAILLITHDMGVMAELADEVIVMYAGEAVEHGTREEIVHHPLHPYTQALMEASFLIPGPTGRLKAIRGSVPAIGERPFGCPFHPRCPFAWNKCHEKQVPDFFINQRSVKCFLYEKSSESQPPQ